MNAERATQYVFSGRAIGNYYVGGGQEEGNVDDAEGALRLKQSIAGRPPPLPKPDRGPAAVHRRLGPRPPPAVAPSRAMATPLFHPTAAASRVAAAPRSWACGAARPCSLLFLCCAGTSAVLVFAPSISMS